MVEREDEDDYSDMLPLVNLWNKGYGYAGIFNHNHLFRKESVELSVANDWCRTLENDFFVNVGELKQNKSDPPDCIIGINGEDLGLELVQLVDESHKKRAIKGENFRVGQFFLEALWTRQRFLNKLNEIIESKGSKYGARGISIDILLIYTAEPFLNSCQAKIWLNNTQVTQSRYIRDCFLLFDYEPNNENINNPLIYLFGESFKRK